MAPLRTAVTTTALRRATQRFVSEDGNSTASALLCGKKQPQVRMFRLSMDQSTATAMVSKK
jgi:hypothetical protein